MIKKGCFLVVGGVLSLVFCAGNLFADVFGRENDLENLYGKGVHAFFDADYRGAIRSLSEVEELDGADPRPYFFLGLAQLRLGQDDQAEGTLKKAAALEWAGRSARDFNVSDALKRIQGLERLYVESFRRQAKLDAEKADQNRQQERYGQERAENKSILARLAKGSDLPPPESSRFIGAAPFGARSIDPFRDPGGADNADSLTPIAKPTTSQTDRGPVETTTAKPKTDDEDPLGMSADEKEEEPADMATTMQDEKEEEEKEEKEEEEDDDDPFK